VVNNLLLAFCIPCLRDCDPIAEIAQFFLDDGFLCYLFIYFACYMFRLDRKVSHLAQNELVEIVELSVSFSLLCVSLFTILFCTKNSALEQ